jgi:heme-binding protein
MTFFGRACVTAIVAVTVALGGLPVAAADPPDCTAADLARVMSGITSATADYLFSHPEVNTFFTGLRGVPKEQRRDQITTYLDANPQVRSDLQGLRQPAVDFRSRCGAPTP